LLVLIGLTLLLLFGNIILRFKVRQKTTELQKELAEREKAESAMAERVSLFELGETVIKAIITESNLRFTLQQCTDALVKNLDASFARIWLLNHSENILVLEASSGLYTHIDGVHSRVHLGELKIGKIAADRQPITVS
jgi:two-component system NtrC family sensor kinase